MHERRLTSEGRITLPPNFAEILGPLLVAWQTPDGGVRVMPRAAIDAATSGWFREAGIEVAEVGIDRVRRLTLPARLRQSSGLEIGQPVILLGMGDAIEVWSRSRYEEYLRR